MEEAKAPERQGGTRPTEPARKLRPRPPKPALLNNRGLGKEAKRVHDQADEKEARATLARIEAERAKPFTPASSLGRLRTPAVGICRTVVMAGIRKRSHQPSIHHPGQSSNLATAYPSAADLPRRLKPMHTQCHFLT